MNSPASTLRKLNLNLKNCLKGIKDYFQVVTKSQKNINICSGNPRWIAHQPNFGNVHKN